MPEPLTLAEFKTRLAVQSQRQALGINMTDAEALRLIVDDQQVAELYVQWRTGAFAATPEPAEMSAAAPAVSGGPPPARVPFYRRPGVIIAGVATVVVLIVVSVIAFNALGEQMRKQQFAEILSRDTTVSENLRNLEGDNLDATFNVNCEKVRDGWTLIDQAAAATRNWEAVRNNGNIDEEQWMANNLGTFQAAQEVCG